MRRMTIVGLAAALVAGLMLLPAGASARSTHKSCPRTARVDRNHDRIPDRWECRHNLSLKVKTTTKNAAKHVKTLTLDNFFPFKTSQSA